MMSEFLRLHLHGNITFSAIRCLTNVSRRSSPFTNEVSVISSTRSLRVTHADLPRFLNQRLTRIRF
jgi:hypothetical protein